MIDKDKIKSEFREYLHEDTGLVGKFKITSGIIKIKKLIKNETGVDLILEEQISNTREYLSGRADFKENMIIVSFIKEKGSAIQFKIQWTGISKTGNDEFKNITELYKYIKYLFDKGYIIGKSNQDSKSTPTPRHQGNPVYLD